MDNGNTPSEPVAETPAPDSAPAPVESESSQPNGSTPDDLLPEAPESPTSDSASPCVESANSGLNQPESNGSKPAQDASQTSTDDDPTQPIASPTSEAVQPTSAPSAPTPPTSPAPQPQSSAQSPQAPIPATPQTEPISGESAAFRNIQARGRSKIQTNRQEKLDKLIQFAQKKQIIENEEIQKLLRISSATATRYLEDLVKEGRMVSEGLPRHAKYRFIR